MAIVRFGIPDPNDAAQVVATVRRPASATVTGREYLDVFPYGVFVDAAGVATIRSVDGHTSPVNVNQTVGVRTLLNHPDSGMRANAMNGIAWTNQSPLFHEERQPLATTIEADQRGGRVYQVIAPFGPIDDAISGLDSSRWFGTFPYNATVHSTANAAQIAGELWAQYSTPHPSILAMTIWDDVATIQESPSSGRATEAAIMIRALAAVQPRPVAAIWTSGDAINVASDVAKVWPFYYYPLTRYEFDGTFTLTPEGDFHRFGNDYKDVIAIRRSQAPPGVKMWFIGQAHQTFDTPQSNRELRYPTPREMRALVWIAVGEGMKAFFWFPWTDGSAFSGQPGNVMWQGLGNAASADRMAVAGEMGRRISPSIRSRLLDCDVVAAKFTATGGGTTHLRQSNYPNAYISTLYDAEHDLTYCVVCNHDIAAANVTISSATLQGSLVNLENGSVVPLGTAVSLPALDGAIYLYRPGVLLATMTTASNDAVTGIRWMRTNGGALTGVANNGAFEYRIPTASLWLPAADSPVDDHDGNYGEAHKLHGLCLKYLRTHDASLIADIEAQVQWHITIEQGAVAAYGSWWQGSAPYWYWTSTTPTTQGGQGGNGSGGVDPTMPGGVLGSMTYNQGNIRRATSIDQLHMVAHGLYAYRYLLRNEPAITANTTLWANALSLIQRMATFEATSGGIPSSGQIIGNLSRICQGLTPTTTNGITASDYASTYRGDIFAPWQVSNVETNVAPSSNSTIDTFFRGVFAPNSTVAGVTNFLHGRVMDMLASDVGRHDVQWDAAYTGTPGTYPAGWALRAQTGDKLRYQTPRALPSNNGFSTDLHYTYISSSAARDGLTGRAPQRLIVLCLMALLDPTYQIPTELAADGTTVLRSVPIRTAVDEWAATLAANLPDSTTKCIKFMAQKYLGITGSHRDDVIDSAFTGYWMMAIEMWHLVNNGANYATYYPIGLW